MQTRRWRQLVLLEKFRGEGKRASFKMQLYLSLFPTPIPIALCLLPTSFSSLFGGMALLCKFFFLEFSMMNVLAPQNPTFMEAEFLPLFSVVWNGSLCTQLCVQNYCLLFEAASGIHPAVPSSEISGS